MNIGNTVTVGSGSGIKKDYPSVSIVVPVYNGAGTISACLESLLCQDYPSEAFEILVVENGSTDNTSEIVSQYPSVCLLHSPLRGPAVARNYGIEHSRSKIIAFTDADCVAEPNWLTELVKGYENPEIGGVGGRITAYLHPGVTLIERFSCEHAPLINFISGAEEFLPHLYTANASYYRGLLNQVGGFNSRLVTAEDVDLSWRIQLNTAAQLTYCDQAVIHHHHRATRAGLARQYRQYGFGEILLDTLYQQQKKYPRTRFFQFKRMSRQFIALLRYMISILIRTVRFLLARVDRYQLQEPWFCFMVESNNLLGKLDALVLTRFMKDAEPVLQTSSTVLINRYFPKRKD